MKFFKFFSITSVIVLLVTIVLNAYFYYKKVEETPTSVELIEQAFGNPEEQINYLIWGISEMPSNYKNQAPIFLKATQENANEFFTELMKQPYTLANQTTDTFGITYADMNFENLSLVTGEFETIVNGTIKIYTDTLGQTFPMQISLRVSINENGQLKQVLAINANVKSTENGLVYELQANKEMEWVETNQVEELPIISETGMDKIETINATVLSVTLILIQIYVLFFSVMTLHSTKDMRIFKTIGLLGLVFALYYDITVGMILSLTLMFLTKKIKEGVYMTIYTLAVVGVLSFAYLIPLFV